jgi:ribosomal-protein-alanine N-acetyltransferase
MSFTLRPMRARDVPVVVAIDRLSFPTPWPTGAFRRELQRERATYLVLVGPEEGVSQLSAPGEKGWLRRLFTTTEVGRIIGYVGFRLQEEGGHITTIAVHPGWRGRGFGGFLLWVALQRMVEHQVDVVTLEMRPSNDVAYRLYRKFGFGVVRFQPDYYRDGEDAWVMAASLGDQDYRRRLAELGELLTQRFRRQDIEVGQINDDAL